MEGKEKKDIGEGPELTLLGLGIAGVVLGTIHWAISIIGVLFLIAFGYLLFEKIKRKRKEDETTRN